MNERAQRGLSRYHAWCGGAAAAIDPDRLEVYITHLGATVQPATAMEYLWGLLVALRERDPGTDLVWMERRLREQWLVSPARPRRNGPGRGSTSAARRRRLLVAEWPAPMREAWRAAQAGSNESVSLLDEIEGRAHVNDVAVGWSPDTVDQRERAMGAFLRHLTDEGQPLAVAPSSIENYIAAMRQAKLMPKTVATRIVGILRLAEAMWPEQRWRWLQNRAYGLSRQAGRTAGARPPCGPVHPDQGPAGLRAAVDAGGVPHAEGAVGGG